MYRPVNRLNVITVVFVVLSILLLVSLNCNDKKDIRPMTSPSPTDVSNTDRDGVIDVEDYCPAIANLDQIDKDDDGIGNNVMETESCLIVKVAGGAKVPVGNIK